MIRLGDRRGTDGLAHTQMRRKTFRSGHGALSIFVTATDTDRQTSSALLMPPGLAASEEMTMASTAFVDSGTLSFFLGSSPLSLVTQKPRDVV